VNSPEVKKMVVCRNKEHFVDNSVTYFSVTFFEVRNFFERF